MIGKSLMWAFSGRIVSHALSFVFSVFLARVLMPEDFGLFAIPLVFIHFSHIFIDGGFGAALIQKKEVSRRLYSSVFWLNLLVAILLVIIYNLLAPLLGDFYTEPLLVDLLRLLSLVFIFNALGIIQNTLLSRAMNFRRLSTIEVSATLLSGVLAVYGAWSGWGVWALVVQYLAVNVFRTAGLWSVSQVRFRFLLDIAEIRSVWVFSSRIFTDGVLTNAINSIDTLVIGKMFSTSALGLYNRGKYLSEMVRSYSASELTRVLFPAFSKMQDDTSNVRKLYLEFIKTVTVLSVGLALLLFYVADELIVLLYSAKWSGAVPFFKLFIWASFLHPLYSIANNVIIGIGNIRVAFKLGLLRKFIRVIGLIAASFMGLEYFAFFISIQFLVAFLLNAGALGKLINLNFFSQLKIVLLNVLFGILTLMISAGLLELVDSSASLLKLLIIKSISIISFYSILQYLFNRNATFLIWDRCLQLVHALRRNYK